MSDELLDRREFLRRAVAAGGSIWCLAATSVACRTVDVAGEGSPEGEPPDDGPPKTSKNDPSDESSATSADERSPPGEADLSCTDTGELSDMQIKTREMLQYSDETPKPGQYCEKCVHWTPADEKEGCGSCEVLAGPIHPRSMNQLPSRRDDRMISPTSLSFILDDAAHRLR